MAKIPLIYEYVFAKSPEKIITAQKKPTRIERFYIQDPTNATEWTGRTVYVGQKIRLRAFLEWQDVDGTWKTLTVPKTINFYHRLNTGTWEKIGTLTAPNYPSTSPVGYDFYYTLDKAGTHTFYAEFPGDTEYAGCAKRVEAFSKQSACC